MVLPKINVPILFLINYQYDKKNKRNKKRSIRRKKES